MLPSDALSLIIRPTLALMGPKYQGQNAERLLLAIGLQESGFRARVQIGGPARGFFQFEKGGVVGVFNHPASSAAAVQLCAALHYAPTVAAVYAGLSDNDALACGFARLLIYTDPAPLPVTQADGWACYQRLWRPGRPRPDAWAANWSQAQEAVQ